MLEAYDHGIIETQYALKYFFHVSIQLRPAIPNFQLSTKNVLNNHFLKLLPEHGTII